MGHGDNGDRVPNHPGNTALYGEFVRDFDRMNALDTIKRVADEVKAGQHPERDTLGVLRLVYARVRRALRR